MKHSLRLDDKPVRIGSRSERVPHAMEVDALSKGGKSESDKGNDVTCWICNIHGHMSRDSFFNQGRSKGKGRDKSREASDQKDGERERERAASLEIALLIKVSSRLREAEARTTSNARARKRACIQSRLTLGVNSRAQMIHNGNR